MKSLLGFSWWEKGFPQLTSQSLHDIHTKESSGFRKTHFLGISPTLCTELIFTKTEENFLDQTTQLNQTLQELTNPGIFIKTNKTLIINGASSKERHIRYQRARLAGAIYLILHRMQGRYSLSAKAEKSVRMNTPIFSKSIRVQILPWWKLELQCTIKSTQVSFPGQSESMRLSYKQSGGS